jgi:putative SOS response-associated peptidase YedK
MCGRFTLTATPQALARRFELDEHAGAVRALSPRFNVAPGQDVANVHHDGAGRVLQSRRWGLVPAWADDVRVGARMINARAETVAEKPAFRAALCERRCLIPADGFYEWAPSGQPYHVAVADGHTFAMAGLWERWQGADGAWLETCAVVTTQACAELADLHPRMPVILPSGDWAAWLDPASRDPRALTALLRPWTQGLRLHPVGRRVNDVAVDEPDLRQPVEAAPEPRQLGLEL